MTKRVLILGDSYGAASGQNYAVQIRDMLAQRTGAELTNSSVPSSNIFDVIDRLQELLGDGSRFDVVVLQVGINDSKYLATVDLPLVELSWFKSRLDVLVDRVARSGSSLIICGLPWLQFESISTSAFLRPYWYWDVPTYLEYDSALRNAAASEHYCSLMEVFDRSEVGTRHLFADDGVHPSNQGHREIARLLGPHILRSLDL